MSDVYLWLKAIHVISVVAWMAGLFYLPRLFVYHSEAAVGGPVSEQFKIMERRLAAAIMRPAAVAAWLAGLATGWTSGDLLAMPPWLLLKLVLVVALTVYHGMLESYVAAFRRDLRPRGQRYFRLLNEVPTLLLIGIVILVIVRPI